MKKIATTTMAVTFTLVSITASLAANGETPLGNCYNHVISVCNQGSHPTSCAESGMDACDEEFASIAVGNINKLKAKKRTSKQLGLTILF